MPSSLPSSRPAVLAAAVVATACIVLLTYRHYRYQDQLSTLSDDDEESNSTSRSQPGTPNSKKKSKKRKRKRKKKKSTLTTNDAVSEADIDPDTFQFPPTPFCPICNVALPFRQSQKTFLLCCGKEICRACNADAYVASDLSRSDEGITDIDDGDDSDYKVACCKFCGRTAPGEHDILNLLKERADNGDANAMHIISGMYMDGNGVQKDQALAVELCQQAADGNSAEAAHEMAVNCSQGRYQGSYRFVEQDVSRAKGLLAKAARLGSIKSLTLLGNITASEGNAELAVKYWRIAALAGDAFALETCKNAFASGVMSKDGYATALRGYQSAQAATRSEERDRFEKELVAMNSPQQTFVGSN